MTHAKRNFCKAALAIFICLSMLLSVLGVTNIVRAHAEGENPYYLTAEIPDVKSVQINDSRTPLGQYGDKDYHAKVELLPGESPTQIKFVGHQWTGSAYEDRTESLLGESRWQVTTDADTFLEGSYWQVNALHLSVKGNGAGEGTITFKFDKGSFAGDAANDGCFATYTVYVVRKAPIDREHTTGKMNSLTMVGNGVSQTHGTMTNIPADIVGGASNGAHEARANEKLSYFFDNYLINGKTLKQNWDDHKINYQTHVCGPGQTTADFAIYKYFNDADTAFNVGDTIVFLRGFTLIRKQNNKWDYYYGADGKMWVMEETCKFRYNGSAFVTYQGINNVSFAETEVRIEVGETVTKTATVSVDADTPNLDKTVTYTTSNPTVATVDQNTGLVTGVAAGTVTITATSKVDGISASYELTVKDSSLTGDSAMIDGGALHLVTGEYSFDDEDGYSSTGYNIEETETAGTYNMTVNKYLYTDNDLQLRVRYGVEGGKYVNLTNAEHGTGYMVAETDVERTNGEGNVIAWTDDYAAYTLQVKDTGTETVKLKVWLPASDENGKYGKIAAKDEKYYFGEITLHVTVEEENLTEYFTFSGARKNKDGQEVLIDYNNVTLGYAGIEQGKFPWNNSENASAIIKAELADWYDNVFINGMSRDAYLAATGKNINLHIRAEYLDFFQYVGTTETPFDDGDTVEICKGFKMIMRDGNGDWTWLHAVSKRYMVLAETVVFQYDAEAGTWTNIVDTLGVKLDKTKATVAVEEEVTVTTSIAAENVKDTAVTFTIADDTIASVTDNKDGTYTVKLLKAGKTTVTFENIYGKTVFTIGDEESMKEPEPTPDLTPDPDGDGDDNKPEETKKKKKCGGSVAASATGAAVALMLAAGVVLVCKKRKNA